MIRTAGLMADRRNCFIAVFDSFAAMRRARKSHLSNIVRPLVIITSICWAYAARTESSDNWLRSAIPPDKQLRNLWEKQKGQQREIQRLWNLRRIDMQEPTFNGFRFVESRPGRNSDAPIRSHYIAVAKSFEDARELVTALARNPEKLELFDQGPAVMIEAKSRGIREGMARAL